MPSRYLWHHRASTLGFHPQPEDPGIQQPRIGKFPIHLPKKQRRFIVSANPIPEDSASTSMSGEGRSDVRAKKFAVRAGWVLTVLSGAFFISDGVGKLLLPPAVVEGTVKLGFPESLIQSVGVVVLTFTLLYLIPRTAVLGAVLLTAFLGGAVATQLRAGMPMFEDAFPVFFALVVWGGIYLREPRLCSLLPLRRC